MIKPAVLKLVAFVGFVLLLAGCAPKAPKQRVLWPIPPAEPRYEFINAYYSQHQMEKTGAQRTMEAIAGEDIPAAFARPFGVATDGKGRVFVSDPGAQNIRVYDFNKQDVAYYSQNTMGLIYGLAVDSAGRLYAAEKNSHSIHIFGPDHSPIGSYGRNVLQRPIYVTLNERLGRIYVSDTEAHQVTVLSLDDGRHLFSFGKEDIDERGGLYAPQGIAIDKENRVFVADGHNARIVVFDADGKHLYSFGERGDRPHQLEQPRGLAFDSEGHLYITDARKGALLTFATDGTYLLSTGGPTPTTSAFGFGIPTDLWIDGNDRIYVADLLNQRFTVWQYLNAAYLKEHPITKEDIEAVKKATGRD